MVDYKAALVTGGARRLGRALVEFLSSNGIPVAIHCHASSHEADALASEIKQAGGRAEVLIADLYQPDEAFDLIERASQALDAPIDLLVNNAASFDYDALGDLSAKRAKRQIDLNLIAPMMLIDAMAQQGLGLRDDGSAQGLIINILDQKLKKLTPKFVSYTLAKSGLWTLTQMSAQALSPNIRVNGIAPGPIIKASQQSNAHFDAQRANQPLDYKASPEDVAEAMAYLMNARSVTGQMIAIDSGQHLNWQTKDILGVET